MRLLTAVLVLLAAPAFTQDTYTIPATQAQTDRIDIARKTHNERTCVQADLPLDCTQTEVRAVGGSFANARIYADSNAGRQALLIDTVLVPWFQAILADQEGWDTEKAQILWAEMDRATKDSVCTAMGLAAGCELY